MNCFKILSILFLCSTIIFSQNINIDFSTAKSYNGTTQFSRNKYINLHTSPTGGGFTDQEISYLIDTLAIGFGRSVGGISWELSQLKEDPNRPGYVDLNLMKQKGSANISKINSDKRWQKYGTNEMIITSHPQNVIPNSVRQNDTNVKGFVPINNDAIAEFYANYVKLYYPDKFRPIFIEPANEPMVHANEMKVNYQDISNFFKVVAKEVKKLNPNVNIGGFASAWPSFELWDFKHWNDRMKTFIDIAGSNMDYLSIHLYDGVNVSGLPVRRSGSNAEAIMDIIEAYSFIKLGKVLPFIISEYGMTQKGWTSEGYSDEKAALTVNSVNHLLFQQIKRDDRLLKSIPFITDKSTWFLNSNGFSYPWVLMKKVNNQWVYTEYIKFYKFWRDVNGNYALVYSDDPDIQTHLFIDNKNSVAYLCINNLELNDKTIHLNYLSSIANQVNSVQLRRLYKNGNKLELVETNFNVNTKDITLHSQETALLKFKFKNSVTFNNTIVEKNYFTDKYLQNIVANKTISFSFKNVTVSQNGFAKLKLGLGRAHNLSLKPEIKINGTKIDVPTDWIGDEQKDRDQFFGVIDIPFNINILKSNNSVEITFKDNGGKISSLILNVQTYQKNIVNTPPKVEIVNPKDGSQFITGDSVQVEVNASDLDGSIKQVDLYLNEKFVRSEKLAPYLWNDKKQDNIFNNLQPGLYTLKAIAIDNSGQSSNTIIQFKVAQTTKTVIKAVNKKLIYPNPTHNEIFIINNKNNIKCINIFDISGKKQNIKIENIYNKIKINITDLKKGVYFLEIKNRDGEVINQKIYKSINK